MSKLSEIEADWKRGELHSWKYEEAIDLLIRAVRQLGAIASKYAWLEALEEVEDDILELIGGEE